ncbi:MAG TPA: helix-turn-helix domain-containing protein [Alphaproteobacteria bacterium]|jgi:DNA-binding HxlR family transcriptional regulator|nr:helix-turn-helix domain-containing protein [Alphaproteobacteria bacterium]
MENSQDARLDTQTCRVEDVVRMIGGKWKLLILRHLIFGGTTRFNALHRHIEGITQTMLTKQLRQLEADGLVARRIYAEVPPRVEYSATAKAQDLDAFFQAMHHWGERNLGEENDLAPPEDAAA